jgi:hypothetical protein
VSRKREGWISLGIDLPIAHAEALKRLAADAGVSVSAWVTLAVGKAAKLPTEPPKRGRPKTAEEPSPAAKGKKSK